MSLYQEDTTILMRLQRGERVIYSHNVMRFLK